MDRETIDVLSFISCTNQSISTLSWALAMHTAMTHISCLIYALWLHHITCKGSNTQYTLLLSMVVLNIRDQQGKLWLPQFSHLQKLPKNRFLLKIPT